MGGTLKAQQPLEPLSLCMIDSVPLVLVASPFLVYQVLSPKTVWSLVPCPWSVSRIRVPAPPTDRLCTSTLLFQPQPSPAIQEDQLVPNSSSTREEAGQVEITVGEVCGEATG